MEALGEPGGERVAIPKGETPLIQVSNAVAVGTEVIQTVNARELHGFLGSAQQFSHWITGRITKYGFQDGVDFTITAITDKTISNSPGRPPTKDYHVSLDMAKELAMVERNDQGRKAAIPQNGGTPGRELNRKV